MGLKEVQSQIVDDIKLRNISVTNKLIDSGVTPDTLLELKQLVNPEFNQAITQALSTTTDGVPVFRGHATAVLMDKDGVIKGFFTNNDSSPIHHIFVEAAIEKAAASVLVYREHKKRGGLSKNKNYLSEEQNFKKHEGASVKPVIIGGEEYFIGVSGASVNPELNKQALRSDKLYSYTETGKNEPEWRAAGYWDRFCANRIRTYLIKENAKQDVGKNMKIPRGQARNEFFD